MTNAERATLTAIHRWGRTNGWRPGPRGWENPECTFAIEPCDGEVVVWWLSGGNGPAPLSCRYILVESVVQAIDLLVVYGYLPPMWSSAFALAEAKHAEVIETLEQRIAELTSMLEHATPNSAFAAAMGYLR
jgi:hypothetical protein